MEDPRKIHPRYMGLPDNAKSSEVMASKYADEVTSMDTEEKKETVMKLMEEWSVHFRDEGLSVANRHLSVLGEVSQALQEAGKEELLGKFAVTMVDALKSAVAQGGVAPSSVGKLEELSSILMTGIDELKKVTDKMVDSIPRSKLKPTKKTKATPIIPMKDATSKGGDKCDKGKAVRSEGESNTLNEKEGKGEDIIMEEDNDKKTKEDHPEESPNKQEEIQQSDTLEIKMSKIRSHYSDPEFTSYSDKKKMAMLDYYITEVLKISPAPVEDDPMLKQLLYDILDKRRVINVCRLAMENTLTEAQLIEAITEAQEAFDACSIIYGNYACEVNELDGVNVLTVVPIME